VLVTHGKKTFDFASRFCASYHEFAPGIEHGTLICCNGGPPSNEIALLFSGMNAKFFPRINDSGWDISAYMDAAKTVAANYDMLLCLGESNYFWKEGWLKRMAQAWNKHGPGFYGVFGSHTLRAHLNTTAFATSPHLLLQYPLPVTDRKSRLEFEHGEGALWRRLRSKRYPVRLVTWSGDWGPGQWRVPAKGLWSGDQSDLLWFCSHSDNYKNADAKRKENWNRSANRRFL